MHKLIITVAIFCGIIHNISCLFDPLSLTLEAGFDFIKDKTYCQIKECCNRESIPADIQGLKKQLSETLFGQHIVQEQLIPALEAHFSKKSNSQKPLVISFHGTTGTGKTFVANHIANKLYVSGLKSRMDNEIRESIKACPRSLFIFDEVDGTLPGIFDFLKPLLDYNSFVDGLNVTQAIFIFLSNSPGTYISDTLGKLIKNGILREDTKLSHFENFVATAAYNLEGGLMKSSLIEAHVIDHFIPFLPLEKTHVLKCIKQEFKHWDHEPEEEVMDNIINTVTYDRIHGIFATSGCKKLASKVRVEVFRRDTNS